MSTRLPYLSIVITSRNDDHGGNMFARMFLTLDALFKQIEKYQIESELILMDYNPPIDKPLLRDIIPWPQKLKYCTIRNFIINSDIHKRFKHHDLKSIHCIISQNSGIRRARGEFILPGAMDLIYSDEVMSLIASKKLNIKQRYRVNRCDTDNNILKQNFQNLDQLLKYCQKNIIHINKHLPYNIKGLPELHTNASGDFQLMSHYYWHLLRAYQENDIIGTASDGLLSFASYAAGIKEVFLKEPCKVYHINHDNIYATRVQHKEKFLLRFISRLPFLSNDFKQKLFLLYVRLGGKVAKTTLDNIPTFGYYEFIIKCQDMISGKKSYIFNDENWGLGNEKLPEYIINVAEWDNIKNITNNQYAKNQ